MSVFPRLVAIGGGGFTHEADPSMEDFLLACQSNARPRIGFVGTASHDDPVKIARFHARFAGVASTCTYLPLAADAAQAQAWVDGLDIVYVGGGNTLHLVAHWHRQGIDRVMLAAARRGVLMAGVSAGANVWFAQALSDSGGQGLAPAAGIGLVPGSCCPHYSSEPKRQGAFSACIAQGTLAGGVGIDDGAAVLIDGAGTMRVFAARPGAGAYRIERTGERATRLPVPPA